MPQFPLAASSAAKLSLLMGSAVHTPCPNTVPFFGMDTNATDDSWVRGWLVMRPLSEYLAKQEAASDFL